jgi:hypothetical protein
VAFYKTLGFTVANQHPEDVPTPIWVWLNAGKANLMLHSTEEPIVASEQRIFFYVYVQDVASFREEVIAAGIAAGPLTRPFYLPRGEFEVRDPDGYAVMIAQLD